MFKHKMKVLTAIIFSLAFVASFSHAQVCTPTPSNLAAWYRAEGNANDSSSNGNHGTLQNGATFGAGQVGQGFNLDGVNDFVEIPHNDNLNVNSAFTAEAWIFPETLPNAAPRIFDKDSATGARWQLSIANDPPFVNALTFVTAGFVLRAPNNSITLNQWNHVAVTVSASNGTKLYVNGVEVASRPDVPDAGANSAAPLLIGDDRETHTRQFNGLIDEATIYNRALSASEIQAIFNAGTAGKCTAVLAASATVGGRVLTARGRGIAKVSVTLTDRDGFTRTALTNPFGYFFFDDVEAGETYVLSIRSKRYSFANATRVISVVDELSDVDFIASP